MLRIVFAHILWYRKVYRIPLRKSLKSYREAIFLVVCFWVAGIACGWCVEKDFSRDMYGAGERLEKLQIYFETEMYEEASVLLDELITQFPDEPRFKYLRAVVDYQRGSYERAQEVFVEFVKEYPGVAEPYYLLGEINLKQGNIERAKQYLRRYCELVPEDLAAHQQLSSLADNIDLNGTTIIKEGKENSSLVKKIGFYGYGACVRSQQAQSIKLINGMQGRWASMGIELVYPVDLRGKQIVLELKGRQGGEKFELTFRDKFAQDYNPQLVLVPEEEALPHWQRVKVRFEEHQSEIDLSCVVHIGLEFGFSTVQNPANSTLFVKDIIIEDAHN